MDNRREVREFLVSRRGKVTPERAGLRAGGHRRVPGLRRTGRALYAPAFADPGRLGYEEMELVADPGSRTLSYTAEPDSPSADALQLLASWGATQDPIVRSAPSTCPLSGTDHPGTA